jgi:hypothetical protein
VAKGSAGLRDEVASASMLPRSALWRLLLVVGMAIAALILGYIGLSQYLSQQAVPQYAKGWTDIVFLDIQLFVLNAAPASGPGSIPVPLGIARFLAPAATAVAAVEAVRLALSEQRRRWSAASASDHAIVTGDGPVAVALARRLSDGGYRKVVLVSATPAGTDEARNHRLLEVFGDPSDAETLRAAGVGRADELYACTEDSTTNAATALRAREFSRAHDRKLATFAQVRDAEICVALRAQRIGTAGDARFRLDFFAIEDIAARVLLDKHPLAPGGTPPVQVVIIGFGRLGRAVLREIARRLTPDDSPLTVAIRGESADTLPGFLNHFPAVREKCRVSQDGEPPPRPSQEAGPTLTFVCLSDNDDALTAGLAAAHSLTGRADRVVICMSEPSPFGTILTGRHALLDDRRGRLAVFGVTEEGCVPGRIREDLTDQLARAIHQAYVDNRTRRGDSPRLNKSMRPWEELPPDRQRANLTQAKDIGVKLEAIDSIVVPRSASAPEFAFTAEEIEQLARMEHRRWVQDRQAEGYVHGLDRESGQHPDLVDWEYLSESAREKDRDAIRELPQILRQAGFQILRLPPRSP